MITSIPSESRLQLWFPLQPTARSSLFVATVKVPAYDLHLVVRPDQFIHGDDPSPRGILFTYVLRSPSPVYHRQSIV